MTLLRMVPANHPQQVKARGPDEDKDERYTPMSLFLPLHDVHRFTVDVAGCAAAPVSGCIGRYYDKVTNGLAQDWAGERVWCNPPYSGIRPWLEKAWASRCTASFLLPNNRCEQRWWQDLVEPYRDGLDGLLRVRFIRRREEFGTPEYPNGPPRGAKGKASGGVPFGLVLVTWTSAWRPDWCPR